MSEIESMDFFNHVFRRKKTRLVHNCVSKFNYYCKCYNLNEHLKSKQMKQICIEIGNHYIVYLADGPIETRSPNCTPFKKKQ